MNPDTLKDTCPHRTQCLTLEECTARTTEDPTSVFPLGERLLRRTLLESGSAIAHQRQVVVVVPTKTDHGDTLWLLECIFTAGDRVFVHSACHPSPHEAWNAGNAWMMQQLYDLEIDTLREG